MLQRTIVTKRIAVWLLGCTAALFVVSFAPGSVAFAPATASHGARTGFVLPTRRTLKYVYTGLLRRPSLTMTTIDDSEKEVQQSSELQLDGRGESSERDATDGGGLVKTVLLAVPLFCKFVIVLLIKFLTDLVVFPLLFLYRIARLTKRRVLKRINGRGGKFGAPPNGSI